MKTSKGIGQRLWQAFLLQALLISVAALMGVYAARYVLGDILIKRALELEANHFWSQYDLNDQFPTPFTYNLRGYLLPEDDPDLPDSFSIPGEGFHRIDRADSDFFVVYNTTRSNKNLVLVFNGQQVGDLALFFGMFPLAGVLIVIYLSSWLAYRYSSRAVSPIIRLSKEVERLDPSSEDFPTELKMILSDYTGTDQDVSTLSAALARLAERIEAFVVRERNFTRDASHELRSPITVIKIAADLLLDDNSLSDANRRTVERIKTNAADMEELIQALLLLARESENTLSMNPVSLNDVVVEEIQRIRDMLEGKPVEVYLEEEQKLTVEASDKVLSVMIGNLIRNAYSYTDEGRIDILIKDNKISIKDSGIGMSSEQVKEIFKPFHRGNNKKRGGYGVGLTIVKMLSERFLWPISIDSEIDKGTTVTICFTD